MNLTKSNLTRRIMKRILLVYFIISVISLALAAVLIYPMLRDKAYGDSETTLNYIKNEYSMIVEETSNYLSTLSSMPEFHEMLSAYQNNPTAGNASRIKLYLTTFQQSNDKIIYTYIEDESYRRVSSIYYQGNQLGHLIGQNQYLTGLKFRKANYQSPVYVSDDLTSFFFSAKRFSLGGNKNYIFVACYDASNFLGNIDGITRGGGLDHYLISNKYDEIVYSTFDPAGTSDLKRRIEDDAHLKNIWSEKTETFFSAKMFTTSGYTIGAATLSTLFADFIPLFFAIIIFYFSMYPIHKKNLALLHDLSEEMQTFSIGDPPPVIIKSNDEVEVLGRILNNLVTNVNIQAKDIAIKEKENAQALYKLMITQLDPHFVRNTMNIINIMARHNRNEDIIVVNNALLRILRDRLNTTNAIFATVADEIKMLQQYMLIISYRYASSVNISYDVNEDAEDKFILKNILQLLVENSLFHGLLEEDDTISGNISVMIYPMEDSIVIEVNDDGKGIEEDRLKLLQESNYDINRENNDAHIGLKNIYDRLSYIYDEFHMEIFSEPGNGTTVIISTSVATTPGMK